MQTPQREMISFAGLQTGLELSTAAIAEFFLKHNGSYGTGKLASLNRSWQSNSTFRASGMAGIEPMPSESNDWTNYAKGVMEHISDHNSNGFDTKKAWPKLRQQA